jgi:hypothetical protein
VGDPRTVLLDTDMGLGTLTDRPCRSSRACARRALAPALHEEKKRRGVPGPYFEFCQALPRRRSEGGGGPD